MAAMTEFEAELNVLLFHFSLSLHEIDLFKIHKLMLQ